MRRLVVVNNISLDGVMQAPGGREEDTRGGFEHGGWATKPNEDPDVMGAMGEHMADTGPLVFGRRTYEQFYSFWPHQRDNPFTEILNSTQKYVASRTLTEPLPWSNSTLLEGDAAHAVARLKEEPGKDLVVLGSGDLLQSLIGRDLVDEYLLLIHPIVLGNGRRLFAEGSVFAPLRLVRSITASSGVIVATYQRANAPA
jgi:dihydrofolate reductase